MAIFGWVKAWCHYGLPGQPPFKTPAVNSALDCGPWVIGGIWPAELSATNAQTAPLISHLRADLQRIVDAANGQLDEVRRTAGDRSTTRSREARIVNDARAFAEQRVESTVRLLRASHGQLPRGPVVTDSFTALN